MEAEVGLEVAEDEGLPGRSIDDLFDEHLDPRDRAGVDLAAMHEVEVDKKMTTFFNAVASGTPLYLAGIEAGWAPGEVDRRLREPAFKAMYEEASNIVDDQVEAVLLARAKQGRQWAVTEWLRARRPEKWGERKHVQVTGHHEIQMSEVRTVQHAIIEATRASEDPAAVIRAIQQRSIEATATDADD